MNPEPELEAWRTAWRTPVEADTRQFDIRGEQSRQERRLRMQYLMGLATAVTLIGVALYVLHTNFRVETAIWAAVVIVTTVGATGFQVWNWRTLWRTAARSVQDYADLYEQRCLAMLRMVRFGYVLLVVQSSIAAPWLTWDFARHELPAANYAIGMGILAVLALVFVAQFRKTRRRALSELRLVQDFRRGLRE